MNLIGEAKPLEIATENLWALIGVFEGKAVEECVKARHALSVGDGALWMRHIEQARMIRRESEGFRDQIRRRALDTLKKSDERTS